MKKFLLCLTALLVSAPVMADEVATASSKAEQQLDEIVVTATRGEKQIDAAPGQVAVIKQQDIAKRNVKTIDESLKHVAGVYDRRSKGLSDTLAAITLHGIPDQKRTLILVDGVTLNNAYTSSANLAGYSPADLERVEVVQGPASSLYGGTAMGGVVSFITRMPEEREASVKVVRGEAYRDGEANDDVKGYYVSFGDNLLDGRLSYFMSMNRNSTRGYSTTPVVVATQPPADISGWYWTTDKSGNVRYQVGDKGANQWWDQSLSARVQYELNDDTRIRLGYTRTRREYDYDVPTTRIRDASGNLVYSYTTALKSGAYGGGSGGLDQEIYSLTAETAFEDVKVKLGMGLNSEGENWYVTESSISLYDGVGKLSSSPNQSFATDLQVVAPLGSRQVLTVGGSFKHDQSHSKDRTLPNWTNRKAKGAVTYTADGQDVLYGLFVQDEIAITDKLTAYAGLRADWWKVYDGEVNQAGSSDYPKIYASRRDSAYSPKLALVYQPLEQTTCKLSAGKAFRAPSIYDLYRTWSSVSGSKTTMYNANPMLKPETVNAWDMSVKQGLWQGADVEISYFENYLNDLIYRVTVSNTATLNDQIWTNAGKAETKGFTVSANQQVQDWLRLYGNTTVLTSSKVVHNWAGVKNGQNTHGKHLQQLPMRMINLGVEGQYKGLTASLNGRYVSRRFSTDNNSDYADDCYGVYEAYSVADAKLSYTWRENATIAVAIDNLFDRDYWDSYKAPGRTSYVEVGFKF